MGSGQSKEVEEENIMVNVPVNSPKLEGDHYELHQYHSGTVKAMLIILLVIFMAIILCVVAVKRLCQTLKNFFSIIYYKSAFGTSLSKLEDFKPTNIFRKNCNQQNSQMLHFRALRISCLTLLTYYNLKYNQV